MTKPRRAAITGLGAVSGFGVGAELLFQSLASGRRALAFWESLRAAGYGPTVAMVPGSDPLAPGDRATGYALVAAAEAVADAGGVQAGARLSISLGTTLGALGGWLDVVRGAPPSLLPRESFVASPASSGGRGGAWWTWAGPARALATRFGAGGAVHAPSVACASANAALGLALDEIRSGRATQVLAGGVDALSDFVLGGFAALKACDAGPCRPFDRNRAGLNLGEGACVLVVEDEAHARARGARIHAFLDGYGSACDAHHMTGPDPEGGGAARALCAALDDAQLDAADVDYVSAHGTATLYNDLMEAKALHAVLGARASSVPVNSIKGSIGHTLGAAGAFEALLAVRSFAAGLVVPTAGLTEIDPLIHLDVVTSVARRLPLRTALSGSSGFGGTNAAIVLRAASAPVDDRARIG